MGSEPRLAAKLQQNAAIPSVPLSRRAFFALDGELIAPGPHELKFEVSIEGRTAVSDVIQLPFDSSGGIVELLAGDPAGLADVLARAERAGKGRLSVSLDGRTLKTFTPAEFRAYNERFQHAPPAVLTPSGEVRTFAPGIGRAPRPADLRDLLSKGYDPQCVANCDTNRDWCYQNEPSCEGVDYCEICEDEWASCHNNCWICTDPKSTSQYTTSSLYSATFYGSSCLEEWFYPHSRYWYDSYSYVIRNYRWQRTEYCDGSHTDTLLYTWDTTGSCLRSTFFTCSFSFGTAYGPYCPF